MADNSGQPTGVGRPPAPAPSPHPPPNPHAAAGNGHDPGGGGFAVADVASELSALGVSSEKQIRRCCAVPGICPVGVALLAEELEEQKRKRRIDSVPGVLITKLTNGYAAPATVSPEFVARLANRDRRVLRVAGFELPPGAVITQNPSGVFWDGGKTSVRAEDLRPESIVLSRRTK